ncbi:MAG: IS1595 family transposase [Candidatus Sulfotelmatobacter sp.]|jgi:transposase-like protein
MNRRQTIPKELRYTIDQFNDQFPNDEACFQTIAERRYPGGMAECEKCGTLRKHHRVTGRTAYACDRCGNHIFPLAGTIFEKTTTKLRLWFYAIYLMSSTRCGISAKQIQRETGVTYKTAWRMFKQIRSLLAENIQLEGSSIEVDEMYYGGKRKGGTGRPMRGDKVKTPVLGMVERKGRVIAKTIPDTTAATLVGTVHEFVLPKSTVFTDELNAYNTLPGKRQYNHQRINHSSKVYVVGDVHTNTIEGFWSLVKLGIGGVYHSVSQKYLQNYLDEYSYRYNRRDTGNLIFHDVLAKAVQPLAVKPDPKAVKMTPEISVPF